MVLCQQKEQTKGGRRDCCHLSKEAVSDVVPVRWEALLAAAREPQEPARCVQRKQSALPLPRLSKNLAPSRKACFCNLLLENSGKFSKQSVKLHNTAADTGRASFFGASWGLRGAEPPGLRDGLRE